ncbi:MAG TPA: YciI family protein [Pyrinomonadaceae bacterium]
MRYMLLIYSREGSTSAEEEKAIAMTHHAVMKEATQKGIFHGAEPLMPTSTATTVRRQDGQILVTDGPFAETKEQLAGYYILDCENLDEAVGWARKIPTACHGGEGSVEIRPIRSMTL